MIPIYGFLEGDTMGVVVLADDSDTVEVLAEKLQSAARMRVMPRGKARIFYEGREIAAGTTVTSARMQAETRFDVLFSDSESGGANKYP
jgi:hypothetical protein